jgi:two-component system, chemotaxis family, chemotaxis protein CheY
MGLEVLVVDDSLAIRRALQRVLTCSRMPIGTVHEAANGEQALKVVQSHRISLILVDIRMDGMDGLTLLKTLKDSPSWAAIPVVMITAEAGETQVSIALKLGAAGYVRKPFSREELEERLTRIMESTTLS